MKHYDKKPILKQSGNGKFGIPSLAMIKTRSEMRLAKLASYEMCKDTFSTLTQNSPPQGQWGQFNVRAT